VGGHRNLTWQQEKALGPYPTLLISSNMGCCEPVSSRRRGSRELRDLTRYRTRLVEERAREVNRLQKTLEDTNLKLGDVVSDVMGKAARMILSALVEGRK
jgi:hypothetical protein